MSWSVADVLDPQFLTAAYHKTREGQQNPMLDMFNRAAENVYGDTIEVTIFPEERVPAPTNVTGGPARTLAERGATKAYYTPIRAFNEMPLAEESYMYLRQEDNQMLQDKGRQEVNRQLMYFQKRHELLRAVVLSKTLFGGVVYQDASGNIKETSSTGPTINLGVAAGHKSQLNWDGNGAILGTSWSNAAATILTDLDDIKIAAEASGVPVPTEILVNSTVKAYLRANTELKAYFQNANMSMDAVLRGNMIEGLGGYNWHFFDGTYVDPSDGTTVRKLVPDGMACIFPAVTGPGGWFRAINGSSLVKTDSGIIGSVTSAGTQTVFGDYVYGKEDDNPATLIVRGGTKFLYAFSDPDAVWMPTITGF